MCIYNTALITFRLWINITHRKTSSKHKTDPHKNTKKWNICIITHLFKFSKKKNTSTHKPKTFLFVTSIQNATQTTNIHCVFTYISFFFSISTWCLQPNTFTLKCIQLTRHISAWNQQLFKWTLINKQTCLQIRNKSDYASVLSNNVKAMSFTCCTWSSEPWVSSNRIYFCIKKDSFFVLSFCFTARSRICLK